MDTLCGVGLPELIILFLIGFVVIGPERSQEVALIVGRWLRSLMTSSWWKEFNQITNSIRNLPTTLVRMAELEEAQADINRAMGEISQATSISTFNLTGNEPSSAAGEETITDPWGIRNATAQTTITPRQSPSDPPTEILPTPLDDDSNDR